MPHYRHLRSTADPIPGWARLARLQAREDRRRQRWDRVGQVGDAVEAAVMSLYFGAVLFAALVLVCIGGAA